jgi:hypothetical protein
VEQGRGARNLLRAQAQDRRIPSPGRLRRPPSPYGSGFIRAPAGAACAGAKSASTCCSACLACEANEEVRPVHAKAMPAILTRRRRWTSGRARPRPRRSAPLAPAAARPAPSSGERGYLALAAGQFPINSSLSIRAGSRYLGSLSSILRTYRSIRPLFPISSASISVSRRVFF